MHVWHVNASGRSSVKLLHGVIDVGDIAFICPTSTVHTNRLVVAGSVLREGFFYLMKNYNLLQID